MPTRVELETFDFDFNKKMNRPDPRARNSTRHPLREDVLFLGTSELGEEPLAQVIGRAAIHQGIVSRIAKRTR